LEIIQVVANYFFRHVYPVDYSLNPGSIEEEAKYLELVDGLPTDYAKEKWLLWQYSIDIN